MSKSAPGLPEPQGDRRPLFPEGRRPATAIADLIVERLAGLDPLHVAVEDDSAGHAGHAGAAAGAGHFSVTVVSERFAGAARLARHRAVLDRVSDLIPHPVHALAIRAFTPDEFFSSHERTVR